MSIGIERIAGDLAPPADRVTGDPRRFRARLELWEDLLTLLVDESYSTYQDLPGPSSTFQHLPSGFRGCRRRTIFFLP